MRERLQSTLSQIVTAVALLEETIDETAMSQSAPDMAPVSLMAAAASTVTAPTTTIANFAVDLNTRTFQSDKLVFALGAAPIGMEVIEGTSNNYDELAYKPAIVATGGVVMLADLNLINSPVAEVIPFTIIDVSGGAPFDDSVVFAATTTLYPTPVGTYQLFSLGNGNYELRLMNHNPQASRGGVAVHSMMASQLMVVNAIFDHVYIDSAESASLGLGPWQFREREAALWGKQYYNNERLSFGGDIGTITSHIYGVIVGFDFPSADLGGGWKFLPTIFGAYNGAIQKYEGIKINQNGGELGFMGSVSCGGFIGSAMVYGGGYQNLMEVGGYEDTTGNWFVGGALKAAYNIHATKNIVVQPNVLTSYNYYGSQTWTSNYGDMSMQSGHLQGWNIAPGLMVMYGQEVWNVHASFLYMHNMHNNVCGKSWRD
jgi:hypothetical protein